MSEKSKYEAGLSSQATQDPQRIVFITRKTSAKVKGKVDQQVMTYPNLLLREAIVFEILTIVLVVIALFWNAPLEQLANPLVTPNPAKAPWYFLGLQELLHYFPPILAGILIPTLVVIGLVVIPYFEVNIKGEPLWAANRQRRLLIFLAVVGATLIFLGVFEAWDAVVPTFFVAALALAGYAFPPGSNRALEFLRSRALPWWVMTWFITVAVTLTAVGTFFRGPGWSLIWPWR
jgi:quinol---cytochrome c reductase cytochrome c subunit, bacillus type